MTTKRFFAGFLLVSLVLAGLVSYYASSSPDGLEKVASDKGISAKEKDHSLKDSPLGDYGVKGVDDARLSGGLAGVIGVAAVLAVGGGLFWVVRRRGPAAPATPAAGAASGTPAPASEPSQNAS
ncbi:PDGLE domain-containing protein [Actinomadura fibrosa]|uniref:PDGLE domain-containing protein n=1 Tax=Actinomadura fibrosa TaxID=111802 RepID=A0ABW2XNX0_9ACTN|nr:PDGLE domain-containing protein [Actinomadura fibrosa]